MSDLEKLKQENEALKKENEMLKNQAASNSQGINKILMQIEAYKGELADARTISMQLRMNMGMYEMKNKGLEQQVKSLQAELDKMNTNKSAEVTPKNLEGKPTKS